MALYLTLEHAYVGGAAQAIFCAGVMGGVVSLMQGQPTDGGNAARRRVSGGRNQDAPEMGLRAADALRRGCGNGADAGAILRRFGALSMRCRACFRFSSYPMCAAWVTSLIECAEPEEMTQSEAVAIRQRGHDPFVGAAL